MNKLVAGVTMRGWSPPHHPGFAFKEVREGSQGLILLQPKHQRPNRPFLGSPKHSN